MTTLTTTGGKIQTYETSKTWPSVNKVFNVFAFDYPERRFTTSSQAPYERRYAYRQYPSVQFLTRGAPQLTWFEGTYDVPTGTHPNVNMCSYPKLVGPPKGYVEADKVAQIAEQAAKDAAIRAAAAHWSDRSDLQKVANTKAAAAKTARAKAKALLTGERTCLDPGKLTPEERAALAREKAKQEAAISQYISQQEVTPYTGPRVRGLDGLGATDEEVAATSRVKRTYRTTELALVGLFAAGLYLVLRK